MSVLLLIFLCFKTSVISKNHMLKTFEPVVENLFHMHIYIIDFGKKKNYSCTKDINSTRIDSSMKQSTLVEQ